MRAIQNPILPGFHSNPSICRVGDDYYIANSTFEWFPGVPIHHSRDLVDWRLIGHALTRRSQLDLRGVVDSGGADGEQMHSLIGLRYPDAIQSIFEKRKQHTYVPLRKAS